jgi:hypothetical protein
VTPEDVITLESSNIPDWLKGSKDTISEEVSVMDSV